MSELPKAALALCISDVHLSEKPPRLRASDEDWVGTQLNYFKQVEKIWDRYDCPPIMIAGDIFDQPRPSLGLINKTYEYLNDLFPSETIYTCYGNHDLPYHRMDNREKCGLYTLTRSGAVVDLEQQGGLYKTRKGYSIFFQPFSWGKEACDPITENVDFTVAVVHKYAFPNKDFAYHGASDKGQISKHGFDKFDFVHYGDNHQQWRRGTTINPGAFIRRTKTDLNMEPAVYVLMSDKTVERIPLDVEGDRYEELNILLRQVEYDTGLKSALDSVQGDHQDIEQMVKSLLTDETSPPGKLILSTLQECK